MKPNKIGIWEWFDEQGNKKLVHVVDFGYEIEGVYKPYFRVAFHGGYYNVNDESDNDGYDEYNKAEWPDSWGNYVGPTDSIPFDKIYYYIDENNCKN